MAKKKLIPITIGITYDPTMVDQEVMRAQFNGHDGGGYCFLDGMRDEFFIDEVTEEQLIDIRNTCRNLRRRKGVESASVSVDKDEE